MKRLDIKKLSVLIDSSNDPYVIKISTRVIVNEQEFIEYESVYPLILKGDKYRYRYRKKKKQEPLEFV